MNKRQSLEKGRVLNEQTIRTKREKKKKGWVGGLKLEQTNSKIQPLGTERRGTHDCKTGKKF